MAKNEHPAQAGMDHRAQVMKEQNTAYYKRSEAARPTPTQEEADRATLGIPVDLEPDGSPPEEESVRKVMESRIPGNNPYDTRSMDAPKPAASAPAPKPQPKG
jgi:coenzyme F420-reducing hydrogenase gamma subunit